MKFYGIRHKITKKPLGFSAESNAPGEECISIAYNFEESQYSENIWLVTRQKSAEDALTSKENPKWYNAGHNTPSWDDTMWQHRDEYEVFEVEI
jgi:hypothetical protein